MHPNPAFRRRSTAANLSFARARGFGALTINGGQGPLIAHVPFVLTEKGDAALLHLVRSNPIARVLDQPLPCVLAVTGADGYVSPDWYGMPDQVPTWNYVAVHMRGHLERVPEARLEAVLDTLSEDFETRLSPKPPWRASKMDSAEREHMMRAIVPVRLTIDAVEGTWKLSQNKPASARMGAAQAIGGSVGQELATLSALMRAPPENPPEEVDSAADGS